MGVIYKLKKEVIDYIVQKKQAEPSLSCRQLVRLLRETFQVEVSKSSINAVIKEFKLSNPVGRRSTKAPKNFYIPSDKKQQLLAQVVPFLSLQTETDSLDTPAIDLVEPTIPLAEEVKEEPLHLSPDLLASAVVEEKLPDKPRIDWSDEHGALVENMGFFFVRVLMQDMLRRPVLGRVLARAADMLETDSALVEGAFFVKAMGISSVGDMQNSALHALALIFDADLQSIENVLGKLLGKNLALKVLSGALETELAMACVQGAFFKVEADTGRAFYLSADLGQLLPGPEGARGCSIFKAIEGAVDRLVTASKPLVFDLSKGANALADEFLLFLDARAHDKLDKVELWSDSTKKLWDFTIEGSINRHFIARTSLEWDKIKISDQGGITAINPGMAVEQTYELKEGYYVVSPEETVKFRAILVAMPDCDIKTVLLTNILEQELSATQILEYYLERWPILTTSPHLTQENDNNSHILVGECFKNRHVNDKNMTLDNLLSHIFDCLEQYTAKTLLQKDTVDILRTFYPLAARVRYHNGCVYVRFELQKTFPQIQEFQTAVDHVNSFCIRDYAGRRVNFSCVFSVEK